MKSTFFLITVFVGLASAAQAGQQFTFADPITNGSYGNSMFETVSLFSGNTSPAASLVNQYTGNVTLNVANFSATGDYLGSNSVLAKYYLSKTASNVNSTFSGAVTSGLYATGAGRIAFVNPANESQTYLQIAFAKSALSFGTFSAAEGLAFSGSLFNTAETASPSASFSFPDRFTQGSNSIGHHTASFAASIGTIGTVQTTPEPASLVAMAAGGFALLRRRRRA